MIHSVTVPLGFLAAVDASFDLVLSSPPPQAATTRAVATKSAIAQAIASLLRMSPPCYSTKTILRSGGGERCGRSAPPRLACPRGGRGASKHELDRQHLARRGW